MIPAGTVWWRDGDGKPRASGDDPGPYPRGIIPAAVNPARAGMIQIVPKKMECDLSKPRASGDDPSAMAADAPAIA